MVRRIIEYTPPKKSKKLSPLSSGPEDFPTIESLEEAIKALRKRIKFLSNRRLTLEKELNRRTHPPQITTEPPPSEYKEPRHPAEIKNINELREFFRTLIKRRIKQSISRTDIGATTTELQEKYSDRPIVQELINRFLSRIKGLTKQEKKHGQETKENLTGEFVTNLQSRIDEIRVEEEKRKNTILEQVRRETEKTLKEVDIEDPDPDLIGIPPDAKFSTLRRKSPPPANKFTRLSRRKPEPQQ